MVTSLRKQVLSSFSGLHFEPVKHIYTLDNKEMTPVTHVVKRFALEFDTENISKRSAERYGGTAQEYKDQWAESGRIASQLGTRVHDFAERYFYNHRLKPSDGFEEAVVAFWKDVPTHIIPLLAESRIYTRNYQYAGTFDNLFYDTKKKGVVITDYKTNKDIYKNFAGQRLISPFKHLLDTPFNKYQIQTSLYQIPFEDIGINVVGRFIIWVKPNGKYEMIPAKDYTKEIRSILN